MLENKSKDGWKVSSTTVADVVGSWLTKSDISIAAFVQSGIPACTVYVDNKSQIFLVLQDGKLSIQYTNDANETNFLDASDLDKLIKIKNILK